MNKLFLIAWKDLTLAFRDKAALILMLAAPFALTLGLGAVTGSFSRGSAGFQDIPVVIVNNDEGEIGKTLIDIFQSEEMAELVEPTIIVDPEEAKRMVDENESAAAIFIPAGFTNSITTPSSEMEMGETPQIEFYANPTSPTSASVIKTILDEFINRVEINRINVQLTITTLLKSGRIGIDEVESVSNGMVASLVDEKSSLLTLKSTSQDGEDVEFSMLGLLAPGMALMFLMYATSNGGRSLLVERRQGTLPRLLVSPTSGTQVLGGKVIGIFLTGVVQMIILILGTTILFQLEWGDPLGVLILVLAAVFGATGWGMLITALVKTPGQASAIGSAVMLTFGILGGSFINLDYMSDWFRFASKITPNAWGLDGFTTLALGGNLADILMPIFALVIMGIILFSIAVIIFNRRGLMKG